MLTVVSRPRCFHNVTFIAASAGGPSSAISPGMVNFNRIRDGAVPDQWISRCEVDGRVGSRRPEPANVLAAAPVSRIFRQYDDHILIRGKAGQNQVASVVSSVELKFDVARQTLAVELTGLELLDVMNGNSPRCRDCASLFQACGNERRTSSGRQRDSLDLREPCEQTGARRSHPGVCRSTCSGA